MRIVVLGGAGFIGSAVCRTLVGSRGATVLNIDKLTASSSLASLQEISASPRYSFRRADICDRERMTALLHAFNPDAVVHAVMERQTSSRIGGASEAFQTNALGTWRLLDATRDYWESLNTDRKERFRFVSVSSSEGADTPAAASRAGADELVTAWHKSYGLPTIVSKAVATFGPYQFPSHCVPAAVLAAVNGVVEASQPAGEFAEWLHVDDHVAAVLAVIEKGAPGATYSVAGCGSIADGTMDQYVRAIVERQRTGRQKTASVETRPAGKSVRLEQDTGWKPSMTLESALANTVRWYLANEAWWRPLAAAEAAGHDCGLLRIA